MVTETRVQSEIRVLSIAPGTSPRRAAYLNDVDSQMGELQLGYIGGMGDLENLTRERNEAASKNRDYMAGVGRRCHKYQELETEISSQIPDLNESGKRLTIAEREALLERRKTQDTRFQAIEQHQALAEAQLLELDLAINLAERKLTFIRLQVEYVTNALRFLGQ